MCTHLLCAQAAAIPHARVPDDRRRDRHDERVDALVLIFPSTAVPVLSPRCVEERPDDARAALAARWAGSTARSARALWFFSLCFSVPLLCLC